MWEARLNHFVSSVLSGFQAEVGAPGTRQLGISDLALMPSSSLGWVAMDSFSRILISSRDLSLSDIVAALLRAGRATGGIDTPEDICCR